VAQHRPNNDKGWVGRRPARRPAKTADTFSSSNAGTLKSNRKMGGVMVDTQMKTLAYINKFKYNLHIII